MEGNSSHHQYQCHQEQPSFLPPRPVLCLSSQCLKTDLKSEHLGATRPQRKGHEVGKTEDGAREGSRGCRYRALPVILKYLVVNQVKT